MPGPPPKRDAERRRRNQDAVPTESVNLAELVSDDIEIPVANEDWHAIATLWYNSLAKSGQSIFYEPGDWATAYLIAESISRDLEEQVVGITEQGEVIRAEIPMKGASLAAYLKAMSALMVTEGDRRKVKIELERAKAKAAIGAGDGNVVSIVKDRESLFK